MSNVHIYILKVTFRIFLYKNLFVGVCHNIVLNYTIELLHASKNSITLAVLGKENLIRNSGET